MNNIQHQEIVKRAVKAKFHGHDTLQGKAVPAYPVTAERELRRITGGYMKLLNQVLRENLPTMMAAYKRERHGDSRFDDSRDLDNEIRQTIQKMAAELERLIDQYGLDEQVRKVSKTAQNTSLREWKRMVRNTLGIDLTTDYFKGDFYGDAIEKWISQNILLIKSLPTETLGNMRQILLDSYMKGKPIRQIQKDIQEEYNVSKRRAALLARDQIASLNAQITKLQHQDAGVKKYRWSSSKDSRVRECHAELDGKVFSWDDPPEMWYDTKSKGRVYTGRFCHPGEDICCRCVAIPVFDQNTVDLPISSSGELRIGR